MRKILFRGKRVYDGKWSESVCPYGEMHNGTVTYDYDRNTVGEYTGLPDKNGKKIFEGDIVKEQDDKCIGVVRYGTYDSPFNSDGLGGHMGFYIEWEEGRIKLRRRDIVFWSDVIDVIGNIFDNPELLTED